MREIRVVTPDGYVWFVRCRWAWRWVPWTPLLGAAAARRERARQARRRKRTPDDYPLGVDAGQEAWDGASWEAPVVGALLGVVLVPLLWIIVVVLAIAPIVLFPAWGAWLTDHVWEVAGLLAVLLVAVAVALADRPWLVEAEPMALNEPGRAWRVRGWRRASRCAREVAASIEEGRLDVEPRDALPVE